MRSTVWGLSLSHPGTQAEPEARLSLPAGARARARPWGGGGGVREFSQGPLSLAVKISCPLGKALSVNLVPFEQIAGTAAPNPRAAGAFRPGWRVGGTAQPPGSNWR